VGFVGLTPDDGQTRVSDTGSVEGGPEDGGSNTTRYTPEFRAEAVRLVRSSPDKSIVQIATELGISDSSLHNWLKQSQIDAGQREGLTTEEREELSRLPKENKVLPQERDILKKATLFFAPEDGSR
jgi:transposase